MPAAKLAQVTWKPNEFQIYDIFVEMQKLYMFFLFRHPNCKQIYLCSNKYY